MSEKLFPIQLQRGAAAHPTKIPWSVAENAYSVYAARYGTSQSLSRLAERGGFAPSEMDMFLPNWRDECGKIKQLEDLLETAWGLIANSSGGDWTKETPAWREAAAKWREEWVVTLPNIRMSDIQGKAVEETCDICRGTGEGIPVGGCPACKGTGVTQ